MIHAEIVFWTNDIKEVNLVLPFPPRIGESMILQRGVVKYSNGAVLDEIDFMVANIDWNFEEDFVEFDVKFKNITVYLERK